MLKILQNYCVWLSDAEKVNDKKELTYFCEEIQNMVSEISMRYQNKFDPILIKKVQDILYCGLEEIKKGSSYTARNTKSYVCCFSECSDLLSQWRAYGDDGQGFALGFNANLLLGLNDAYQYDFVKVIYGQDEIREKVYDYVETILKYTYQDAVEHQLEKGDIAMDLAPIMVPALRERFAFKHPGFCEEKEWRLFRSQVCNFDEDSGEDEPFFRGAFHTFDRILEEFSCSALQFRSLRDDICSYFEFGFEKYKENIIVEIMLGPKCKIKTMDLKILLRKYKYLRDIESDSIKISKSYIPYV